MFHYGTDLTQIAFMLGGIALVALLVSHASGVGTIAKDVGSAYGGLLSIVTLQNNYGNAFS